MSREINTPRRAAFTILEVLVATTILAIILGIMLGIVDSVRNIHRNSMARIKAFREGRQALETVSSSLSQATLNTYLDYVDADGNYRFRTGGNATTFVPASYKRTSELRFRSGNLPEVANANRPTHAVFFQAPLGLVADTNYSGLENLLNSLGFFIEFGDDSLQRPDFFSNLQVQKPLNYRYRLMQAIQPSESLSIYEYTSGNFGYSGTQWVTDTVGSVKRVVAENIVALVILPKLGKADQLAGGYSDSDLASNYLYDSTISNPDPALNPKAQLPPVVEITVVAADEKSFANFLGTSTSAPDLGLANLFQSVGDTVNPSNPGYARDLKTLEETLTRNRISFRILKLAIPIKAARWSRDQKD